MLKIHYLIFFVIFKNLNAEDINMTIFYQNSPIETFPLVFNNSIEFHLANAFDFTIVGKICYVQNYAEFNLTCKTNFADYNSYWVKKHFNFRF